MRQQNVISAIQRVQDKELTTVVRMREASRELSTAQETLKEIVRDVEFRDQKGKLLIYSGPLRRPILQTFYVQQLMWNYLESTSANSDKCKAG